MSNNPYHHGNLKNALIEAGISYINENGMTGFSLRKIAAQCGVSHTAPYSHFTDKDDLLDAMKIYVSEKFASALQAAAEKYKGQGYAAIFSQLGKAYVGFFYENPQYYEFVFECAGFNINLDDLSVNNAYEPFEIFKSIAVDMFEDCKLPAEMHQAALIKMWGLVHGIAGISVMKGIRFSGDWGKTTQQIIESVM